MCVGVVRGGAGVGVHGLDIAEDALAPPVPPHGAQQRPVGEHLRAPRLELGLELSALRAVARGERLELRLDRELALGVAVKVEGFFHTCCGMLFTEIDDFLRSDEEGEVLLLFTSKFCELELSCDDGLDGFLTVFEGFVETLVGDELGRTFDHQHFGLGSDVDQVEVGIKHFVVVWVGDEFAINLTNAHTSHRTIPRDVRNQCRS